MGDFQRQTLPIKWRLLRALQAGYTRMADMVITPSEQLSVVVQSWRVPSRKVRIVPNAVSSEPDLGAMKANLTEEEFDVVTVCRLLPLKGLESLVETAARERWRLAIVGQGPLRDALEQMIQDRDCRNQIRLFGRLSPLGVRQVVSASKVFVLNSVGEGLSNSLLEAKECGLPVVATAVGGNSEAVRHDIDGYLVPSGDQETLTCRINELLHDPILRARFGESGRSDVATRFSLERMVSLTESALLAAVDRDRAVATDA
jgi:glycosyltransferase involved in cell wall biosynthesis